MVGAILSVTVTVNWQVVASVSVQVTVVIPLLKAIPARVAEPELVVAPVNWNVGVPRKAVGSHDVPL